jgi:uncharacterized damage-inducible protein DinB
MELKRFLLDEFSREAERSRRALAEMPDGRGGWKPHEKSMTFGYLANLVAVIPTWIAMQLTRDELDVAPVDGPSVKTDPDAPRQALLDELDKSALEARSALEATSDAHLQTTWTLKARGHVVQQASRAAMIQDTLNHWAHHRGQMSVYLRLMGSTVPALYGPSADDRSFGPQ